MVSYSKRSQMALELPIVSVNEEKTIIIKVRSQSGCSAKQRMEHWAKQTASQGVYSWQCLTPTRR